ncbi:permease-like cell division protein FtsX [Catenulispora subtropica]|uniref:Cell division protein FtsX n=1 Tax=Catenulispora subtropica TaxID=450798 RepID=A0ABN2S6L5_9ACTN
MRAQFVFSEIFIGLRRNLTMTIAVIVSAAVALGMLGVALLMLFQTSYMKDYWYDKVEVSVFLCTKDDTTLHPTTCASGPTAQTRMDELQADLKADPLVQTVFPETQAEAYARYKNQSGGSQANEASQITAYVSPDQIPASLRVKLKDPTTEHIDAIRSTYQGQQGVEAVADQKTILKPLFKLFNGLTVSASTVAIVMVGLALMLIVNTVRLSAFSRRRETGIMRLVGASNFYIRLPFLMEGAVAGLGGVAVAALGVASFKFFLIDRVLAPSFTFTSFIGWDKVLLTVLILVPVGLVMAVGASALSLRKYLKV